MVRLEGKDHEPYPVNMDHIRLSTFPTRSDPLFIKIIEVVRALLSEAQPRTAHSETSGTLQSLTISMESLGQQCGMVVLQWRGLSCVNAYH